MLFDSMRGALRSIRNGCRQTLSHARKKRSPVEATLTAAAAYTGHGGQYSQHISYLDNAALVESCDSSFADEVLQLAFGDPAHFEAEMTDKTEKVQSQAPLQAKHHQAGDTKKQKHPENSSPMVTDYAFIDDIADVQSQRPDSCLVGAVVQADDIKEDVGSGLQQSDGTQIGDHDAECRWVKLDSSFLKRIEAATSLHRLAKSFEARFDEAFNGLDAESEALKIRRAELHQQVAATGNSTALESVLTPDQIGDEMHALANKESEILDQRDTGYKNLAQFHRELREDQFNFFEKLEAFAVDLALVEPQPTEGKPGLNGNADAHPSICSASVADKGPHSQYASTGERPTQQKCADVISDQSIGVEGHIEMLQNLKLLRNEVLEAQWEFDNRYEQFDREDWEFQRQLSSAARSVAGSESRYALDLRHLEQTREMTQRIISAEAHYERVKLEALELGFQDISSDLESGFVDDVQDGYRLSFEQDIVASIDRGRINAWLDKLADSADCQADTEVLTRPEESQACSFQEVEICDSASLVAEGPYRRRIDEWASRSKNVDIPKAEYSS